MVLLFGLVVKFSRFFRDALLVLNKEKKLSLLLLLLPNMDIFWQLQQMDEFEMTVWHFTDASRQKCHKATGPNV